jgi:hypothetical protein
MLSQSKQQFVALIALLCVCRPSLLVLATVADTGLDPHAMACAAAASEMQKTVAALCAPGKGILVRGARQCGWKRRRQILPS